MDAEDRHLLEAFRRGEESAFAALVIKYREGVYRVARRMLGSHEDAADVTQEVFIRAHRALPRFDGRSQLSTWLYRITVNLCLDARDRRARIALPDTDESLLDRFAAPGLDEEAQRRELGRLIARAVAALPPRQRAMTVLRLYQDLPYQEIARIMGCSEGTVKATMFAAVRRLRQALEAQGVRAP
ncbi:MAG: RNA polymerase sigma factor [Armatimonadota bacterium]|nr:RNA polymerase sigma factor [Armatimonadota bacterium]MDR7549534.1 RNA polymerase sigma factor [Armatimonadota bacterium]